MLRAFASVISKVAPRAPVSAVAESGLRSLAAPPAASVAGLPSLLSPMSSFVRPFSAAPAAAVQSSSASGAAAAGSRTKFADLIKKAKPVTPGQRHLVQISRAMLHKGG